VDLILDAGPLITICKFEVAGRLVIDHILGCCRITVAASVRDEVIVSGARYPDAKEAQRRIEHGEISVLAPSPHPDLEALITPYGLGDGERDSILLTEHVDLRVATLVIDDHLAYLVSDRLGRRKRFLLDLIVDLFNTAGLSQRLAMEMARAVQSRYPPAFVEHTLLLLQR
jgi:predicted nucleic acid-binding protein